MKCMKYKIALLPLLFAAIFTISTVSAAPPQKIRVACIGNSITYGSGATDRAKTSYPAILAQLLGDNYEVRNFGLGGRTLLFKGNRPYINEPQYAESMQWMPEIVIIKLGTNDSKPMNWDAHSAEFEHDLRVFVKSYLDLTPRPKVYLCEPIWIADERIGIYEKVVAGEIIPIIHKVAAELGVEVIDLHKTLKDMPQLVPDGVHPNDLGYTLIAKDIFERIKK